MLCLLVFTVLPFSWMQNIMTFNQHYLQFIRGKEQRHRFLQELLG